jgi:hypothetical protein
MLLVSLLDLIHLLPLFDTFVYIFTWSDCWITGTYFTIMLILEAPKPRRQPNRHYIKNNSKICSAVLVSR